MTDGQAPDTADGWAGCRVGPLCGDNLEIACTPAMRPYRGYQKGIVDVFMFV
jgi:hypothetical protein